MLTAAFRTLARIAVPLVAGLAASLPGHAANYSDLWWNPGESGWGLAIVDRGDHVAALWLTYREDGSPTWYSIPHGTMSADRRFLEGDLYESRGPAYTDTPFDRSTVNRFEAGTATIDFAPAGMPEGWARFSYTLGGVSGSKAVTRQPFGNGAVQWGSDLTEFWGNPEEDGWGYAIAQHGDNAFGILFVYGADRMPTFMVMPGVQFDAPTRFSGAMYATRGPWLGSPTFDPGRVTVARVGEATVTFAVGSGARRGVIDGTIGGARFVKPIEPQILAQSQPLTATGSACTGTYSLTIRHKACPNGIPFAGSFVMDPITPRAAPWTRVAFGGRITREYEVENGMCVTAPTRDNTRGQVFLGDDPGRLQMYVYADGYQFLNLLSTVSWSQTPRGNDMARGTLTRNIDPADALFTIEGEYTCVLCYTRGCPPN